MQHTADVRLPLRQPHHELLASADQQYVLITTTSSQLGRKIAEYSVDPPVTFFQRVSVLIQRYNSILFHETFPAEDEIDT